MEMETVSTVITRDVGKERTSLTIKMLRLNAMLWLAVLVLSFALTIPVAMRYEKSQALTVLNGKLSLDFEQFITKEHPYRDISVNSWAAMDLKFFNAGKPGVIIGTDGWLFTLEEFPLPSSRKRAMTDNLENIRKTVEALRSKGIETIILPIPAKADIYKSHVPLELQARVLPLTEVTNYLSTHHIAWIPVEEDLRKASQSGEQTFFRTETHWTPAGARIAAAKAAAWLQAQGKSTWPKTEFNLTAGAPREAGSDLENFIPVRPTFAGLLPPAESYIPYKTTSEKTSDSANDLFGLATNPVALVGTSYSADERWNFAGWLRMALHTDIDNISEKAKGPFFPMEKFIRMQEAEETQAKLVIWEMPVRGLTVDYAALSKRATH